MQIRDRIKELKRVPAKDLIPHPKNWRVHSEGQANALRGILADVGYVDALLVRETPEGLQIIDGHLRAEITPDTEVPVLILDVTEAEADKILATFDPLAAMADVDAAKLESLLAEIETDSESLQTMLDTLAKESGIEVEQPEIVDPEPQIDRAAELQVKWKTERGQLWEITGLSGMVHRLFCGDSTDSFDVVRLMGVENINVAFTSPPYASQRKYDESSGFKPIPPDEYVEWFKSVQFNVAAHLAKDGSWFVNIKPCADGLDTSLYVHDLVAAHVRDWGWHFATEFCWERTGVPKGVKRRFKNQFEPVYQFALRDWKMRPEAVRHASNDVPMSLGKGSGNTGWADNQGNGGVIPSNRRPHRAGKSSTKSLPEMQGTGSDVGDVVVSGMAFPGNRLPPFTGSHTATGHTAAFPVGLPSFFIKAFSDESDSIYDPFLGSGSTMVAAEQLSRRCFGIEISPAYCGVILERMTELGCECEVK